MRRANRCPDCGSLRVKDFCSSADADYLLCEGCESTFTWSPEISRPRVTPNWRVIRKDRSVEYRKFDVLGNHQWYLFAWLQHGWAVMCCGPQDMPGDLEIQRFTLKDARLDAGYGLREFAQTIGILPSIYCNIENGKDPASSVQQDVIAASLGLTRLPYIPPPRKDEGPLIPLHIRKADGQPATEEDYRKMHEYLNDPDSPRGN